MQTVMGDNEYTITESAEETLAEKILLRLLDASMRGDPWWLGDDKLMGAKLDKLVDESVRASERFWSKMPK